MAEKNILLLKFEGVLQSWGRESFWNDRGTDLLPRKSAVIGLLGCAMGLPRKDPRLLDLNQELTMGIRVDAPGVRMKDFQTVTGHPLMTAEGKPRSQASGNTFLSRREYLQDASFLVALQGNPETLGSIAEALQDPVWPIFLGRKNCVPTRPVFEALTDAYSSIYDALVQYELPMDTKHILLELESKPPTETAVVIRRDDVSEGVTSRDYGQRQVWRCETEVQGVSDATHH